METLIPAATGSRSRPLVRNILINFAGQGAPLIAAAVSMPVLARGFGLERLGLLTLAWVVLGSLGLLDLGLGRALTHVVAAKRAANDVQSLPGLLVAGCAVLLGVGLAGSVGVALSAPYLVEKAFKISPALRAEALRSLYVLAVGVPIMMASSAARGFLEAHQRFGWVNAVRAPLGVMTYVGPALTLPFSTSVVYAVVVMVVARVAACVAYLVMCWRLLPRDRSRSLLNTEDARELLTNGAWMTSANLVAAMIAYADRLILGSAASVASLAYYATPQEVVGRATVVPMTIGAVMFPAFSAASVQGGPYLSRLFEKTSFYSHLTLFPITFFGAAFAPFWLSIWMGRDFGAHAAAVTQWFCLGVFLNGLTVTPFSFLQANGRADLTAKLQIGEFPVYLLALWYFTSRYGMTGTAVVWTIRAGSDAALMYFSSCRILPDGTRVLWRHVLVLGLAVASFLMVSASASLSWRIGCSLAVAAAFAFSLRYLVDEHDWLEARLLWRKWRGRASDGRYNEPGS